MKQIYSYCLDAEFDGDFVAMALSELQRNLAAFPTRMKVDFKELPVKFRQKFSTILEMNNLFTPIAAEIGDELFNEQGDLPGLVVFCRRDSNVARQARKQEPHADWGATCGCLAVVWEKGNKYLIWHEVLHLLGVMDCYDSETIQGICENPGCLMQYAPTEKTLAPWPECLCPETISRLREIARTERATTANKIIREIWSVMVEENMAAIAFNNLYDNWKWPLSSKPVMAITVAIAFPPFALLFILLALTNLCLYVLCKLAYFVFKLLYTVLSRIFRILLTERQL